MDFSLSDFPALMLVFEKISPGTKSSLSMRSRMSLAGSGSSAGSMTKGYKVFLTGSNANLLSAELGPISPGRYKKITLYPFSFREFLQFWPRSPPPYHGKEKSRSPRGVRTGPLRWKIPRIPKSGDPSTSSGSMTTSCSGTSSAGWIREVKGFRQLAHYLFTNTANTANVQRAQKHARVQKRRIGPGLCRVP